MWLLFTVPGISPNGKSMDFSMSIYLCNGRRMPSVFRSPVVIFSRMNSSS